MTSVTTDPSAAELPQRPLWRTPQLTEVRIEDVTDANLSGSPPPDSSSYHSS
jgi:hypothetical protein